MGYLIKLLPLECNPQPGIKKPKCHLTKKIRYRGLVNGNVCVCARVCVCVCIYVYVCVYIYIWKNHCQIRPSLNSCPHSTVLGYIILPRRDPSIRPTTITKSVNRIWSFLLRSLQCSSSFLCLTRTPNDDFLGMLSHGTAYNTWSP